MTSRVERDKARIRCLAAAVSSLHCEIGRIVQAGEDPAALDAYAGENLAMGDDGESLIGLSMEDLVEMLGRLTATEKLVALGSPPEMVRALLLSETPGARPVDATMQRDLLLYLDGIVKDREVVPADVQA